MTPVWIIPIFAFILMLDRIEKFFHKKPRNYLYLGKAVVDFYFIAVYLLILLNIDITGVERNEAIRLGVLLLFGLNALYVIIERMESQISKFIERWLNREEKI